MNRREAVKNILIASSSTVFLTSFSMAGSGDLIQNGKLVLSKKYQKYLAQISESFLPILEASEKIDPASEFIVEMMNHSYHPDEIKQYAEGFEQFLQLIKTARIKVKTSSADQMILAVEEVLEEQPPKESLVYFINTTRQLSIRNLTTSEFYITDYYQYKLIPGKFNGCLEVSNTK